MKKPTVSKRDERYRKNDREIRKVLLGALTNRSLNLRPKEVCKKATITRPTFYTHCENVDDALKQYEDELKSGFTKRLPHSGRKVVVFTIMLGFINDEKDYFGATISGFDCYLLNILLDTLKPKLGYGNIGKKNYEIYKQNQIALILCWGKHENFERRRIPFYANKMVKTTMTNLSLERN